MRERFVMSSFLLGNLAESATTAFGFRLGLSEKGPVAGPFTEYNEISYFMLKTGVTAVLIGLTALAKDQGYERTGRVFGKTMEITNLIVWGATALNTARIISQLPR